MEESLERAAFVDEILSFLSENGVGFSMHCGNMILVEVSSLLIVPVSLKDASQAGKVFHRSLSSDDSARLLECSDILYLYEDMWLNGDEAYRKRILARCGIFDSVFARKCRVVPLSTQKEKEMAREFLNANHSYGWCSSRYCYALVMPDDKVVAVATFSSSLAVERRSGTDLFLSPRSGSSVAATVQFDSYQWLRYASIAGVRVVGGMGKLLKRFIADAGKMRRERRDGCGGCTGGIEIMSYSDNEWSGGSVYPRLGFHECGGRGPVEFIVEKGTFRRIHLSKVNGESLEDSPAGNVRILNLGSRRFLLQLPL